MVLPLQCLLAQEMLRGYVRCRCAPATRSPASLVSLAASSTIFSLDDLYIWLQSIFPCRSGVCSAYYPVCISVSSNLAASLFVYFYMFSAHAHKCFVLFLNAASSFSISWKTYPIYISRPRDWRKSDTQYQDKIPVYEIWVFLLDLQS